MRVCEKHRERATLTIKNLKDGTEYDFCPVCEAEFAELLYGGEAKFIAEGIKALESGETKTFDNVDDLIKDLREPNGRKRVSGRPKTTKK